MHNQELPLEQKEQQVGKESSGQHPGEHPQSKHPHRNHKHNRHEHKKGKHWQNREQDREQNRDRRRDSDPKHYRKEDESVNTQEEQISTVSTEQGQQSPNERKRSKNESRHEHGRNREHNEQRSPRHGRHEHRQHRHSQSSERHPATEHEQLQVETGKHPSVEASTNYGNEQRSEERTPHGGKRFDRQSQRQGQDQRYDRRNLKGNDSNNSRETIEHESTQHDAEERSIAQDAVGIQELRSSHREHPSGSAEHHEPRAAQSREFNEYGTQEPNRRKMFIPKGPVDDRYPEFRVNNDLAINRDEDPLYNGARGAAIRILSRYDQADVYLDKLLEHEHEVNQELNSLDRALLTELVYGVTRWQSKLDWVLTGFYHGEFVKCIVPVKNAMRIALYQMLMLTKIPPFAAVNESVEIVKRLKGTRSANLVNAVLRNILQNIKNIRFPAREEDFVRFASISYSHPQWMVKRWVERFGEEATEKLLIANNERPKVTLRLNALRASNEELAGYLESLKEQSIKFTQSPLESRSYLVNSLAAVRDWEPFQNGWFSVQDVSASLVVRLADPKPDQLVYDLCAAPGGKTTFMAELMENKGKIVAVDKYDGKLRIIKENIARLGISIVKTICQDARQYNFDAQADVVLVDAPCSGIVTLAKHPDIKWKLEKDELKSLVQLQREILSNAVHMVKPGGTLVYSTCSTELEENVQVAEWFLASYPEFVLERAEAFLPASACQDGYLQTFPHVHGTDGAFGARFIKKS